MNLDKKEKKLLKEAFEKAKKFNDDFNKIKIANKFISYEKLLSTILLKFSSGLKSEQIDKLNEQINLALKNRFDIIYDSFTIKYKLSKELENYFIIPTIENNISTNFESIDLSAENKLLDKNVIDILNQELKTLLKNGFIVEIIKGIAILQRQKIEIYFNKENIVRW